MTTHLPSELLARADDSDDAEFYALPRLVTHVDDATMAALTAYLDDMVLNGATVLDLMSSWVSHLPGRDFEEIVCVGMNAEELVANPRASEWHVHDLNKMPAIPLGDVRFDWTLISFSVQYLTKPQAVFADIARVLKPGGHFYCWCDHKTFPAIVDEMTKQQLSMMIKKELRYLKYKNCLIWVKNNHGSGDQNMIH